MSARSIQADDHIRQGRDLAVAKLEDYVRRTVDGAPPLPPGARERLALLLRGGDDAA